MDKNDIKVIAQEIKNRVEKGTKFADNAAKKVAATVNDELKDIRENLHQKSLISKRAKVLEDCVKELEKENEKFTPSDKWNDIHAETDRLIEKLEFAQKHIVSNFDTSESMLTSLAEELSVQKSNLTESDEDKTKTAIMTKRIDKGIRACRSAGLVSLNEYEDL